MRGKRACRALIKSDIYKENDKMSDGQTISMALESPRLFSKQGLDLTSPARGQLHRVAVNDELFDVFAYVIAVENGRCDVILGSKDAMMASAKDIVLPPAVLGDYVMLSPGLRATVPAASLGRGYALLDECVRDRIDEALEKFGEESDDLGFVRGCPYVSMSDDRIAYRLKMSQGLVLMKGAQACAFEEDYALAAADTAAPVGADFKVEGLDGVVCVRYVPADGHLMLRVFGPDGNRSQALDGWGVFGKDAELLGSISDASFACEIKDGFDGILSLADEDGNVYPLQGDTEQPEV